MSLVEFWYDHHHTGALRVIDYGTRKVYGSDPQEQAWECPFDMISPHSIRVNFRSKKTHRGKKEMIAVYTARRNRLEWPDGNVWLRVRHDPRILLFRNHGVTGTIRRADRSTIV
jgi:hypothetical protein